MLFLGQAAHTIFNNDNRPVDDDAKVKGAKTHQIGTDLALDHPRDGEKHR